MSMSLKKYRLTRDERAQIKQRFKRTGELTRKKLIEYIPAMLITNLSTLLLISVDGLVVGNLVGGKALSAVNIFSPATLLIGVISTLIASGIGICLSTGVGANDPQKLLRTKSAMKKMMAIAALFVAVAQIPAVNLIISSYHLSPEMEAMTRQYAIGVMISSPFGLISTVGVHQLQIVGKMKALMWLAITEGVTNLVLDIVFVSAFQMGVAGAGFGTAGANIVRCTTTVLFLVKKTSVFNSHGVKSGWKECKEILFYGLPDASHALITAAQNYFIMLVILSTLGENGGIIKGTCAFAFSVTNVLISSVQGSLRPLMGLMIGSKDHDGTRMLLRQGFGFVTIFVSIIVVIIELFPGMFYHFHGVNEIPSGGELSLQLFAASFLFAAFNTIFRLYYSNRKDTRFSSTLTVAGHAAIPLIAFILTRFLPGPFLWLGNLIAELIILAFNLKRYTYWLEKDNAEQDKDEKTFYLTVTPDKAVEASQMIRRFAKENGYPSDIAYSVGLCMEEMVAYIEASQDDAEIDTQIIVRFSHNAAHFIIIDNGRCITLDDDPKSQALITNNYALIKKLAKSAQHRYVLNLNYTMFEF
ncbi:MATE family efflux transporter [Ruminococcus sp.]|uniref:MATE family efflux transporter n=1 Tax=Ruminococcus sp. TaxID=41978 RepID=UPI002E800621|nr:MATE family efflux transporter [Ruminococcus sp.]MEE3493297.1 MATE family efflux transporter [Ruminococcus sp.]